MTWNKGDNKTHLAAGSPALYPHPRPRAESQHPFLPPHCWMQSVKNSIFASPQWAGAFLLSLLAAVKLWFRGIAANTINQHLLTLSSPNHHIPCPHSNSAFFVMQFLLLIPALLGGHWTHLLQGEFLDTWSMAGNFFFCKYLTLLHEGTPCEAWAGFVSTGDCSLTNTRDPHSPARLTPSIAAWLLQERFLPWSQCNIKPFLPLFLSIISSKTSQRAAQEQLGG